MIVISTPRVVPTAETSATDGEVRWAPVRSLWTGGMTLAAVTLGPVFFTPGALVVFAVTSALAVCFGLSLGAHRLLVHRSYAAPRWVERGMILCAALAGTAGPFDMVRMHDMRDWAQRQTDCHPFYRHGASFWRDAWWQMHCRVVLAHPPRFAPEAALTENRLLMMLERGWMAMQLPLAALLFWLGGWPFVVWGIAVRIAVELNGFWLVAHLTHKVGPRGWVVDGTAVQGHDLPAAALLTFGEAWHGNHHAWPGSARLGLEPGQHDPGWWVLLAMRRLGLARDLRQPADLVARDGLRRLGRVRRAKGRASCPIGRARSRTTGAA